VFLGPHVLEEEEEEEEEEEAVAAVQVLLRGGAVGEVPTGAGSLVYNDNVAYVIGEMKGKIGAAHSGPSGYVGV
jgi:hypothetical protein